MFYGWAIDQRVEEKRSGGEIDHGRAGDAYWINVSAKQVRQRYRRSKVALPDHRASGGVKRIDIVRFSDRDNHRPARTAFDVQWLSVNVAGDRAIEVEIAPQVRGGRRRKCRINVNAVAGRIVMLLRDVHL